MDEQQEYSDQTPTHGTGPEHSLMSGAVLYQNIKRK